MAMDFGSRNAGLIIVIGLLSISAFALLAPSGHTAMARSSPQLAGSTTLSGTTIVSAPPTGSSGPDDLTIMSVHGVDQGRPLLWTEFQNGINPDGTPGSSKATQSNVVGFDATSGKLYVSLNVTGHLDGVTADPQHARILVTSNEDANSAFYVLNPASKTVTQFNFTPSPSTGGNGGTDSIALWHDGIYVSHSNPNDTTQPAVYRVSLDWSAHSARLSPVFWDDSRAAFSPAGGHGTMALTDPDSSYVMPAASPRFAGQLATLSQADGRIIFAGHSEWGGSIRLTQLNLTDNASGNVPPIDGIAVATSGNGTLYVVDAKAQTIQAFSTAGWPAGTVFVGEPKDNGNPIVGTLNLTSGKITPFGNAFESPKGLLFVPAHHADRDGDSHEWEAHGDASWRMAGWHAEFVARIAW